MLIPLIWMVILSLETSSEAQSFPLVVLPSGIHLHNYVATWNSEPFGHFFLNSALYSLATVAGNLVFCSLAAYAFARLKFFGRDVLFIVLLATLMVPFQVLLIPTFLIVKHLGLVDSVGGLIMPNLCSAFGIFMLRQFFRTLPIELEEAARIDGTSRLGILFKIVLPLSLPALATLAIIQFMWSWNDFLWPLIIIDTASPRTAAARSGDPPGRSPQPLEPGDGGHGDEPDPDADRVPGRAAVVHPLDRVHGDQVMSAPGWH